MMDGLVTLPSPFGGQETLSRLLAAITGRKLEVFATIDHALAAKKAGLELGFSSLVIFGRAEAGTPLMHLAPTLAIDLPLKVLVWKDDVEKAWLTYNAPIWFARRHRLSFEDFANEASDIRHTAEADNSRRIGLNALLEFGPTAGPPIAGMVQMLADITRTALLTETAR
jgi:uncharacterized protein (DUF302 family)